MTAARLLCAAACLLLAAGCTATTGATLPPGTVPTSKVPAPLRYVALGDSYSAGPLIPTTDVADGCFRSDHNYPSLVARRIGARLVDVTCSAARTRDLRRPQAMTGGTRVAAQFHALTPATRLVTIGIGGNDFGLFARLLGCGVGCATLASHIPGIGAHVAGALRAIHRLAPHATVILVGYLRLLPDHGSCARLGIPASALPEGRRVSRLLDATMRAAARRTGSSYVDAYRLSGGHDVCSAHPWVNGRRTLEHRAAAYHPLASGMRAVAQVVERLAD